MRFKFVDEFPDQGQRVQAVTAAYDSASGQTVLVAGGAGGSGANGVWRCLATTGAFTCNNALNTGTVGVASVDSLYNPSSSSVDSYVLLEGAVKSGSPTQCGSFAGGDTVFLSTNDGATFTGVTNPAVATVNTTVDTKPWWFATTALRDQYLLGCVNFQAGQIAVDPTDPNTLVIAGRAGVWRTTNVLAGNGIAWSAIPRGLGVSVDYDISADPTAGNAGQVAVGDADYKLFTDTGHFLIPGQPTQLQPYRVPHDTFSTAFDASQPSCVAPAASCPLFVGYGELSGANDGGVGYYTNVFGAPTYTSLVGSGTLWPATNNRVFGLAPGTTGDQTRRVLAVLAGRGLYEYRFASGTWSAVQRSSITDLTGVSIPSVQSPGAAGVSTNFIDTSWPVPTLGGTSSPDAYVFDPRSGLYHGTATGGDFTWSRIWALSAPSFPIANAHVGHLAGDPTAPDRLYLSYQDNAGYHLVLINNANDGYVDASGNDVCTSSPCFARTDLTAELPAASIPGPLAVDSTGDLYVASISDGSNPANLYAAPTPSAIVPVFTSVFATQADAVNYAAAQPVANRLALGSDCYLYAGAGGGGVSVIVPDVPGSCG